MNYLGNQCKNILKNPKLLNSIYEQYTDKQELYSLTSDLEVLIEPNDIVNALDLWLKQQLSTDELIGWCSFVILADCFETKYSKAEFHFDDMWTILAEISTPEIDGNLTKKQAKLYIRTLRSLQDY